MKANSILGRKCWMIALWAFLSWAAHSACAQTAQLGVSLNVQSSITLVFQNDANVNTLGFCPLATSPATNTSLQNLIIAGFATGTTSTCAIFTRPTATTYQVATTFDIVVSKANSSSASYQLTAKLLNAPPANVTWMVNNTALNNTAFTTVPQPGTYGVPVPNTLQVQVGNTVPGQLLAETITFTATAN